MDDVESEKISGTVGKQKLSYLMYQKYEEHIDILNRTHLKVI